MKMRRILLATILAVTPLAVAAQSSIAGVGLYGTTPTAMLNGGAGYGSIQYAPASFTLTGYNPTGLTPGSTTYTSGITAAGTVTQTCTLTFSSSGSPTTAAVGTVRLSTTNTVAAGSVVTFTTVGTGYGSVPTTAVASNGTATCSGTVAVFAALGAYAPFAVDAAGNLSAGALLGYAIPALAAGCLQSAGTTGPLSWATCGAGGSTAFSALTAPVANTSLTMGAYTANFNFTGNWGSGYGFSIVSNGANASTGPLFELSTGSGTTMPVFLFGAQGISNGVKMDSTGAMTAIGTGSIAATTAANLSGTPALPNGTTATTQSQADASTKLATTAYVDTGLGTKQASGTYVTPTTLNNGTLPATLTSITVTNDGVHPNQLALPWNSTANPAPTNATGWEGAVSATGTPGWFDLPSALPSVNSVWEFAAGSSNHSVPTQVAAPVGAFVGYASVGAVTWSNAGACTYNAAGAYSTDGTVTTVSGQSCAFTPTNLVSGGYYTLIITNAASTAATFTLATSGSTCTAWKVGGAGGGAVTLSGASAIDILAFHMVGTVCYANFKGQFS